MRRGLGNSGVSSLELALVMAAFMLLLIGIFDVARYLFTMQAMEYVADNAARAAVSSASFQLTPATNCPVVTAASVPFSLPPLLAANTTLCVIQTNSSGGGRLITVTVTSPFTAFTPGLSALTSTTALTETTQMTY